MVRCAATKRRGVTTQCLSNAMNGHSLCGTHARAKNVELWIDTHNKDQSIVMCQSLARRWLVLHHLRIAGPGVLCRKNLANDEELVSCTEASRQHPLDYFAFEENGKIWWFDFASIWAWSMKSVEPANPYTRTPLTTDIRKRLREMWALRTHRRLPVPPDPIGGEERIRHRWTMLCQIFADNGFTDVSIHQLTALGKLSHITVWRFLRDDCPLAARSCSYMLSSQVMAGNIPSYIVNSLRMMIRLLTLQKEPYATVFNVMSAIYRC